MPGYDKTGLDDYVLVEGYEKLLAVLDAAPEDELTRALWKFNDKFAYILHPGAVWDESVRVSHQPAAWHTSAYANVHAMDAAGKTRPVAAQWLKWPMRRQCRAYTYEPGKPRYIEQNLNTWLGWGCEPAKGDVKPFKALLGRLFSDEHSAARDWFEQWILYPLAHPGAKLFSACLLWSHKQGVGKSAVGDLLGRIYGKNYISISQRELESDFNDWAVSRQFVMIDDVSSQDSRAKADILKKTITQKTLVVNQKYVGRYEIPDTVNYYLTSNRPGALFIEDNDRRYFVHEVVAEPARDFFDAFYAWVHGDGPSALFYYAQSFDFGAFNPAAPPPRPDAKDEMASTGYSEVDVWLRELRNDPAKYLRVGQTELSRDVWSASELLTFFEPRRKGYPVVVSTLGAKLRELFPRANNGNPVRTNGACGERYYIVRNAEKWLGASHKDLAKHILSDKVGHKKF